MNTPFGKWRDRVDGVTESFQSAAVNFESSTRVLVATIVVATAALVMALIALVR